MPYRIGRILKFWVRVECSNRRWSFGSDKRVAAMLQEFEERGDAMRSLNRRGEVIWKPSPRFLSHLADAELEAEADWKGHEGR